MIAEQTKSSRRLYFIPATISEAATLAKAHEHDFKFIAGGTDVMVNRFHDNETGSCLIDLTGIEELRAIEETDTFLKIGSCVRLDELKHHELVQKEFPVLIDAAHSVASPLIRKSATIGGNILCENRCHFYNQSEFWREAAGFCLKCDGDVCIATKGKKKCFSKCVSDTAPALISMNAQLEVFSENKLQTVSLESI